MIKNIKTNKVKSDMAKKSDIEFSQMRSYGRRRMSKMSD